MNLLDNELVSRIVWFIPILLSLSVHEWAHARTAYWFGDETAKERGRMTLNPIAHIDPIGTLLLPLLGVPFGWAKPVPIDPRRFRADVDIRKGMIFTAAAGPASNFVLATLCTAAYALVLMISPAAHAVQKLLYVGVMINIILGLFNLIPIPPLDGSRVVDGLLPDRFRESWYKVARFGPILLLGVLVAPSFLGFSLMSWPMEIANDLLGQLTVAILR